MRTKILGGEVVGGCVVFEAKNSVCTAQMLGSEGVVSCMVLGFIKEFWYTSRVKIANEWVT